MIGVTFWVVTIMSWDRNCTMRGVLLVAKLVHAKAGRFEFVKLRNNKKEEGTLTLKVYGYQSWA